MIVLSKATSCNHKNIESQKRPAMVFFGIPNLKNPTYEVGFGNFILIYQGIFGILLILNGGGGIKWNSMSINFD